MFALEGTYLRIRANSGGEKLTGGFRTWIQSADKDLNGKRKEIDFSSHANPLFQLQAGRYHIYADRGEQKLEQDVTVGRGQVVDLELKFQRTVR